MQHWQTSDSSRKQHIAGVYSAAQPLGLTKLRFLYPEYMDVLIRNTDIWWQLDTKTALRVCQQISGTPR